MGRTAFARPARRPWVVVDWGAVPCCAMDWAVADRDGVVLEPRSPPRLPSRLSKMLLGDRVGAALLDL